MQIRRMEERDLDEVCEIEEASFSVPWSRNSFLDTLENDAFIYFVVEEAEHIIAYCGMWNIVGEGQITNVAVKADCRKRGIASLMFETFLEEAQKEGVESYTLEVRESNQAAIKLYEKFGFAEEGIRKDYYQHPTENALIMWKR